MHPMAMKAALALKDSRHEIESWARSVGLQGISRREGVRSLEAALDDMARNLAYELTDTAADFDAFIRASDVSFLRS